MSRFLSAVLLSLCVFAASPARAAKPAIEALSAAALQKFHLSVVEDGHLYRGGRPHRLGLEALKRLGVRTVIGLQGGDASELTPLHWLLEVASPGERLSVERQEGVDARELGLRFIWAPLSAVIFYTSKITFREDAVIDRVLTVMNDPTMYPIYVHCTKGRDRTGLVIALWRVQNGMSIEEAHRDWVASGHRGVTGLLTKTLDKYYYAKARKLARAREKRIVSFENERETRAHLEAK